MRISDWSSDVCSSDLRGEVAPERRRLPPVALVPPQPAVIAAVIVLDPAQSGERERGHDGFEPRPMRAGDLLFQCREIGGDQAVVMVGIADQEVAPRSEEHTSELQSLMRISYAVFCLKIKIH